MAKTIRISSDVYSRLERLAVGFETPDNVIHRLLDELEGLETPRTPHTNTLPKQAHPGNKDMSKYIFNGNTFGKSKLVLELLRNHVASHPDIDLKQLEIDFPHDLQGTFGVFASFDQAKKMLEEKGYKRYYMRDSELIHLSDETISVSKEWGMGNIKKLINHAKSLGYKIDSAL